MKILVGNNKLAKLGGSETYTYALVGELVRQGHQVDCIASGMPGIVSNRIKDDFGVITRFRPTTAGYDLVLLSHKTSIELARNVQGFKIQTCHGVHHPLERPVPGMDAYVAVSDEVAEGLKNQGYSASVIYNGVDCDRFYPMTNDTRDDLQFVLSLAHSDEANQMIHEACDMLGCTLQVLNKYKSAVWEVEYLINQADMVISLGRGVYEAAACGRNVVIFDYRPYMGKEAIGDGYVTPEVFPLYMKNNCSGRYTKKIFNAEILKGEMARYDSFNGELLREFAMKHLNIKNQVQKYLDLVR